MGVAWPPLGPLNWGGQANHEFFFGFLIFVKNFVFKCFFRDILGRSVPKNPRALHVC